MNDPIELKIIHYDPMARGLWCRTPYEGHPTGCPNFPKCIQQRPDFKEISGKYRWFAVVEIFNLKSHAEYMKARIWSKSGRVWSDRQCRNPIYWQGGVRSRLMKKAQRLNGDIILDIPEASGVDVFKTMAEVNIILEKSHPNIVRKVMIVGFEITSVIPAWCDIK